MKHAILPILIAAMLALLATACGGSDAREPDTTSLNITNDQLALMPLAASDLGGEFLGLTVEDESGYQTSDNVASDSLDPMDSGADIEAAGWSISYKLDYEDQTLAAMSSGHGVLSGVTYLDLFKDDQSAAAYHSKQLSDLDEQTGKDIHGFTIVDSAHFDVAAGDEGFGLSEDIQFGDTMGYTWASGFRLGRLVAAVQVDRADNTDVTESMRQLASALESKVRGVIAGTVQGTPVPLPTKEPDDAGQASRPDHGPYPDAMALTLADLPVGSTKDTDGYVPEDDRASFERSFDLGPAEDGAGPAAVEVDLNLFPDAASASTYFIGLKGVYLGGSAQEFFASAYSSQPFEVSNVVAGESEITPAGDESFSVKVSYDMVFGSLENEFAYVRVGRVVAALIFTEFAGDRDQGDVDALMAKLVARIKAELGSV